MKQKTEPARRKPWGWGRIVLSMLFIGLVGAGGLAGWLRLQWRSLPPLAQLRHWKPAVPLRIYDANGNLLATVGPQLHDQVSLNDTPPQLGNAFVAAENKYFWSDDPLYFPVDYPAILRAAWIDVTHLAPTQGASTITEQVVRNFYLSPKKTLTRKVQEILLAYKLAQHFDRHEILALYLNKIYFGYDAYGVGAAARVYYGVPVDQLTLPQMAMLAGMPAAPNYYNPLTHPNTALSRRNYVIERMLADGYIDGQEAARAEAAPLSATYHEQGDNVAPYVTEWISKWLVSRLGADRTFHDGLKVYTTIDHGLQETADRVVATGLENYAMGQDSLDPQQYRGPIAHLDAQELTAALAGTRPTQLPSADPANLLWGVVLSARTNDVRVSLEGTQTVTLSGVGLRWARRAGGPHWPLRRGDLVWLRQYVDPGKPPNTAAWQTALWQTPPGNRPWQLAQMPEVQGALVSMDNSSGAIKALVGGFSYGLSHFDRALYANRQPGSAFKPFVYAAALDGPALAAAGQTDYLTQVSLIPNTPLSIPLPNGQTYAPTNYDKTFSDQPIPVWQDLAESKNVPSVRILMQIGIPYAIQYATKFGFTDSQLPPVPSLVLGSADVTPLQMTRGYAVFANGGLLPQPYFITKVTDGQGQDLPLDSCALCEDDTPPPQAITTGVAYLMTTMMQRVISNGTGVAASTLGHYLAGKTGTTNDQKNAWFVGYGQHIVTAVWMGRDDNQSMVSGAAGAREALPIWIHFMQAALQGEPDQPFTPPPDVVQASVDPTTGTLTDIGGQAFDFLDGYLPQGQSPQTDPTAATTTSLWSLLQ